MKTVIKENLNMKAVILSSLFLASSVLTIASTANAAPVLVNAAYVRSLPEANFTALIKGCDNKLGYVASPVSVMNDSNHYTSTGVNTAPTDAAKLSADASVAYKAGLCYLRTGNPAYAKNAQNILDAWAKTLTNVTTKQSEGDINFNMPYMIMSASWIYGANGWDGVSFRRLVRSVVLPVSASDNINNHGAWGILLETTAAVYLNDDRGLNDAQARWKSHISGAVDQWGFLPREITRTNTSNYNDGPDKGIKGLAYTHYFMLPASISGKILTDNKKWVWQSDAGVLFQKAFTKAALLTRYPERSPYYDSNNGQLMGVRNASYFAMLLPIFPNTNAKVVLAEGDIGMNGFSLLELFPVQ